MSDAPGVIGRVSATAALVGDVVVGWLLLGATYYGVETLPAAGVRFALAVPALFVLPGYVLVAALFPRTDRSGRPVVDRPSRTALTVRERLALSVGVSLVVVPLLGFLVATVRTGVTAGPVIEALAVVVGGAGLVAIARRLAVPAEERYTLPLGAWVREYYEAFDGRSLGGQLLLVVLGASMMLALSTAVYAVAAPQPGQTYTDFSLATDAADGEYVAAGYPTNVTVNQSTSLTFAVENAERQPQAYVVVVTLDRVVDVDGDRRRVQRRELDRFRRTLDHGVRWRQPHRIEPPLAGDGLKLSYYLYRGEAPATPTADSAYRHLHHWIDVQPAADNGTAGTGGAGNAGPSGGSAGQ